jgi:hypothetical protein
VQPVFASALRNEELQLAMRCVILLSFCLFINEHSTANDEKILLQHNILVILSIIEKQELLKFKMFLTIS